MGSTEKDGVVGQPELPVVKKCDGGVPLDVGSNEATDGWESPPWKAGVVELLSPDVGRDVNWTVGELLSFVVKERCRPERVTIQNLQDVGEQVCTQIYTVWPSTVGSSKEIVGRR